jgi:serine protease AprX
VKRPSGTHGERTSALWGTGNRGGESRSNVLWGKGGRGLLLTTVASIALLVPFGASAARDAMTKSEGSTYIAPTLLDFAKTHNGGDKVNVIIQSSGGTSAAADAYKGLGLGNGLGSMKRLDLVDGVAVTIPAAKLDKLAQTGGLIVTPDAKTNVSGTSAPTSDQLWPFESGNAANWSKDANYRLPAIAVIDSGIQARSDFGARLLASVNLVSGLAANSAGDGRGHGTFVAGIAAGAAAKYAGAAPTANLVSVDVMDDTGTGLTSDVIAGAQWVLANKDKYNIKVANFSLHSAIVAPFYYDPLDKAVEQLWFNGITVVAAAGNYGVANAPSGVRYSPGNDPFVITVGAADLGNTAKPKDDTIAPWSAWGSTKDGFSKPELSAPGRYMVGPVPATSSLALQRADHVVAPGYMQLSGTSFAAPVVAGTAAQIIARHPNFTPDQVKGALMATARELPDAVGRSAGVGEVNASKATALNSAPNPNRALSAFMTSSGGSGLTFNAASWLDTAKTNASWDSASWDSASWLDASWNTASWASASWDSASWLDASWLDASWLDASWLDASWEDAAEGDASSDPSAFTLDAADLADVLADPDMAPDPASLPASLAP